MPWSSLQIFQIVLKLVLKQLVGRVEFFSIVNFDRNLKRRIFKNVLDQFKATPSRKPSDSLSSFNNFPCLLAILIICLFYRFTISSYVLNISIDTLDSWHFSLYLITLAIFFLVGYYLTHQVIFNIIIAFFFF